MPHRHLGKLPHHPHMSHPLNPLADAPFHRRPGKYARLNISHIRQVQQPASIFLAPCPGGQRQMLQSIGGRYINCQMDAGPPGRRAERLYNPCAAQDADTPQHAQPRIRSLLRNFHAVGNRNPRPHPGVRRPAARRQPLGHRVRHHPARHSRNRRLAHRNARPRTGNGANPRPPDDLQPLVPVRQPPNAHHNLRAVRNIRVVAPVLDDRAANPFRRFHPPAAMHFERRRPPPPRQRHRHFVRRIPGQHQYHGRLGRRRRGCAGSVPGAHPPRIPLRRTGVVALRARPDPVVILLCVSHCNSR